MSMNQLLLAAAVAFLATGGTADLTIPSDPSTVRRWFDQNVLPISARVSSLEPELITAERNPITIRVRADGTGQYSTITAAIESIPDGNTNRVIIMIGPGFYTEKITIEETKRFVTFYGDAANMPTIVFGGTAREYTTKKSATVYVRANYFVAVNVIFKNSAPWPQEKDGDQAVALTIEADMSSFYGCRFLGFQDMLCDDRGNHFFMDCYIEGTVDFVFGTGTSIYLGTELHVVSGNQVAYVTAHGKLSPTGDSGYAFVHSRVTGTEGISFLGRPWRPYARVVFAYSELTDVVRLQGWYADSTSASTVYFGEYQNLGAGADNGSRAPYARELTSADSQSFITLDYIKSSSWLLPPPNLERPSHGRPSPSGGVVCSTIILGHVVLYLFLYLVL